jgi:hypothetical protein
VSSYGASLLVFRVGWLEPSFTDVTARSFRLGESARRTTPHQGVRPGGTSWRFQVPSSRPVALQPASSARESIRLTVAQLAEEFSAAHLLGELLSAASSGMPGSMTTAVPSARR